MNRAVALLFLLFTFVFSKTLVSEEYSFDSFTLKTLPGFKVELAAGPPLIDRPITACFDNEGHLFVAESSGDNSSVHEQLKKKPHRILKLIDEDQDGVFDKKTIFKDKIMFPEGTLWFRGSLYVSAPPSIWKLTDTDGDGVSDKEEEWFKGTLTGCANDLHGPYLGNDGWIYWCKGAFAEQTHPQFKGPPLVSKASHIFRKNPATGIIESVMAGGVDNPVDVVFTPSGERIFTTTFLQHPSGGKRDGLIHALYGGLYGKRHSVLNGHPRTGDLLPPLTHLGAAAPSGLEIYQSKSFGIEFENNLFTAQFNLQKVSRHILQPQGATFTTVDSDFLVADSKDFHPTDTLEAPDGSLLVVDTGGWYKLCCPTSQLYKPEVLGGIYRVQRKKTSKTANALETVKSLSQSELQDWIPLLSHPSSYVREQVKERVASVKDRALPALQSVLESRGDRRWRIDTIWILSRIASSKALRLVQKGLEDPDSEVRQASIHVLGLYRHEESRKAIEACLRDSSAQVRRASSEALGRIGNALSVKPILNSFSKVSDRSEEHSRVFALIEIGSIETLREELNSVTGEALGAALIALTQLNSAQLKASDLAPLISSGSEKTQQVALKVLKLSPKLTPDIAQLIIDQLDRGGPNKLKIFLPFVHKLVNQPNVQNSISRWLKTEDREIKSKKALLRTIKTNLSKININQFKETLQFLMDQDSPELREELLSLLEDWPRPSWNQDWSEQLHTLVKNRNLTSAERLKALLALPKKNLLSDEIFDLVKSQLLQFDSIKLRSLALRNLNKHHLSENQLKSLLSTIPQSTPGELGQLLELFKGSHSKDFHQAMIAQLSELDFLIALDQKRFKSWLKPSIKSAPKASKELTIKIEQQEKNRLKKLDKWIKHLPPGDKVRGQKVFNSTKAACSSCHAIGYLGGKIGPDLTRIGKIRSRTDLLESILFPSVSLVRSYEPYEVITAQGERFVGLLKGESDHQLQFILGAEREVTLNRNDILKLQSSKTSIMPAGLDEQLNQQQLADLITFLEASR